MSTARLLRWLQRSGPSRVRLLTGISISLVSAMASLILLGGAGLLVGMAAGRGGLAALGGLLILIELVAFLRAPLRYEERLLTHRVALGSVVRWRVWLYDVLALRTPGSLSYLSNGDLLDRSIEDIDTLEDLYVRIVLPLITAVVAGVLGVVVIGIFVPLAGLILAVGLLVGISLSLWCGHLSSHSTFEATRLRGEASAITVDLIDGGLDLSMAGHYGSYVRRLDEIEFHFARTDRRLSLIRSVGLSLLALVSGAVLIGVVLCCAVATHQGSLTPAEAAGLSLASLASLEPLLGVLFGALRAPGVDAAAMRLEELETSPVSALEPSSPVPWPRDASPLTFEKVTLSPAPLSMPVIEHLTLSIDPGDHVAILGASGTGKSTLCRSIMKFLEVDAGTIAVGTASYPSLTSESIRTHVALLDQSPTLFAGTLADTLRLGAPDASDAALLSILEQCQLQELLPNGLESLSLPLAEDGRSLSLGQQRRIALARVLLRTPEILLLDEPTAGLSREQAKSVLSNALRYAGDATVILVTHDVEETAGFDAVWNLEGGRLSRIDPGAEPLLELRS